MKIHIFNTFLLFVAAPLLVSGQLVIQGLDVSNPFALFDQTGILRFNNFFDDLLNLFFGKRRLVCGFKMLNIIQNSGVLFSGAYRDNSVMVLPEAGFYVGDENIVEYVSFTNTESPYISAGPIRRTQDLVVIGYNADANECEFHARFLNANSLNKDMTETAEEIHFASPVLIKLFSDYSENYLRRAHVFYPKPFLKFLFGVLHTTTVAEFMCNTVLGSAGCNDVIGGPPPTDCVTQMNNLPLVDGDAYVDGNSFGCRILHASFARANFKHCPHVSLDPIDLDPNGLPTCSVSQELPISRFFDEGDIQRLSHFGQTNGVDPALGYTLLSSIDAPLQ